MSPQETEARSRLAKGLGRHFFGLFDLEQDTRVIFGNDDLAWRMLRIARTQLMYAKMALDDPESVEVKMALERLNEWDRPTSEIISSRP